MSRDSDDLTTQPTATALMERVQQVEVRLAREIDTRATRLEGQISSLEGQISSLKEEIVNSVQAPISSLQQEMVKGFQQLNDKVMTLSEDTLDVRANQRAILRRLNDLEITVKAT